MSGEHNHGGHFWVRHVSIAHSKSACGATLFLHELALCSQLPCQSRRCATRRKVPQVEDPICYLREGGRDPACCCRLAFGFRAAAQAHDCGEPRARAPGKKATAQAAVTLALDATRSLPLMAIFLLLNCVGLFPDFEGLQGGVTLHAVRNSLPRTLPSNAWFALPPVHTSDAPHGQSFGRRPGVVVLNLELSASTANVLQTPACSNVLLTQEELLAEPGSSLDQAPRAAPRLSPF